MISELSKAEEVYGGFEDETPTEEIIFSPFP